MVIAPAGRTPSRTIAEISQSQRAYVDRAEPTTRRQAMLRAQKDRRQAFPDPVLYRIDKLPKGQSLTMKTWVRKSLNVGVLSAGFLLVAGTAAHADSTTGTNAGAASGNQLDTKLIAPVNAEANSLGLFGGASTESASTEGAVADNAGAADWTTGFNAGALTGNQIGTTVQAPINVSDNAVALLGFATAGDSTE